MTKVRSPDARSTKLNPALLVRRLHTYFSVFIAPSILFFAITGTLQVYSLHEGHGAYQPPPIVEKLAAVHKDQVFEEPHHRPPPPAAASAHADAPDDDDAPPLGVRLLKAFFAVVGAGLVLTTLLGLWMAFKYSRKTWTCAALFLAGAILPLGTFLLA